MDENTEIAIGLFAFSVFFSWIYGNFLFYPIATYLDSLDSNFYTSFSCMIILNIPTILLAEAGAIIIWVFLLNENVMESLSQSIPAGLSGWLFYFFLDYWEPPASILLDGTIVKDTIGWSGTSDVVMAYFFKDIMGIPMNETYFIGPIAVEHSLYTFTYVVGPILILILAIILGGSTALIRGFGGESAVEGLE